VIVWQAFDPAQDRTRRKIMEIEIGKVTHYYNHLNVAVISLTDNLKLGDMIHIVGHHTNFTERVASMEVDHQSVVWVSSGDNVAIKVLEGVHEHDKVYRIVEDMTEYSPA
jgi:putative protease